MHNEKEALEDMQEVLQTHHVRKFVRWWLNLAVCRQYENVTRPLFKGLRKLCDEFGVFLIADEIAVGFGRTGTMFAIEQAGICPDFLCLSKGITGGYMPLSVVLFTQNIYDAFIAITTLRANHF